MKERNRCGWAKSAVSIPYHDNEWGVPARDERHLFEMLTLEGAQAGLSWDTILKKRDGYRKAFDNFVPEKVASFTSRDVTRLMNDEGIVRNRLKIESAISNARMLLRLREEIPLDELVWSFREENPEVPATPRPTRTAGSDLLSKELKRRGFRFVGSTICYSFMQAVGIVNDHEEECFRRREVGA